MAASSRRSRWERDEAEPLAGRIAGCAHGILLSLAPRCRVARGGCCKPRLRSPPTASGVRSSRKAISAKEQPCQSCRRTASRWEWGSRASALATSTANSWRMASSLGVDWSAASKAPRLSDDESSSACSEISREMSRFLRPWDRNASATLRARIVRSHFARAASSSPRNWSRFCTHGAASPARYPTHRACCSIRDPVANASGCADNCGIFRGVAHPGNQAVPLHGPTITRRRGRASIKMTDNDRNIIAIARERFKTMAASERRVNRSIDPH